MARAYRPRTLQGLINGITRGEKYDAVILRKIIQRNRKVQTLLRLPDKYEAKLNTLFKKAQEQTIAGIAKGNITTTNDLGEAVTFRAATFQKVEKTRQGKTGDDDKFISLERQGEIFRKLFPALMKDKDVGHENISIVTGMMAVALGALPKNDPNRKYLRALYLVAQSIDQVTRKADLKGQNIDLFLEELTEICNSPTDTEVKSEIVLNSIKGLNGKIIAKTENRKLNRMKAVPARLVMDLFDDFLKGQFDRLEEYFAEIPIENLKGSGTIVDDVLDLTHSLIDPKLKDKRNFKKKSKNTKTGAVKTGLDLSIKRKNIKAPKLKKRKRRSTNASTFQRSMFSILAIINDKLPQAVRKNMGAPHLTNESGRFASSVKLLDVQQTRQGYPSFGYTYAKEPYQVFEEGRGRAPWADGKRDPRILIDLSIREIAANLALGRFYTRRL